MQFATEANLIHRTHLFYFEFECKNIDQIDILLVTQCSIDRIQLIEELSNHWNGPISIALYLSDAEVQSFVFFIESSKNLRGRANIAYHIIYREGVI